MKVGVNIKQYRLEKNLTQKDLADMLYISSQAISRWEKDEVEPSLDMLNKMCEIFGCQLNDLVYGKDYQINESKEDEILEKQEENLGDGAAFLDSGATNAKRELDIVERCSVCGKELTPYNAVYENINNEDGTKKQVAYCRNCYSNKKKENENFKKKKRISNESEKNKIKFQLSMKKGIGWGIFFAICAALITLLVVLEKPEISGWGRFGYCILNSYAVFSAAFCMITNTYINLVFVFFISKSIKFPGIIFSFSLEGLGFLIFVKILFFLIGIVFSIIMFLLGFWVCVLLSMVSFPFIILAGLKGKDVNVYD